MAKKVKSGPKPIQWWIECMAFSVVEVLVQWLPGTWAFHLGEVLGGICWHLFPERRRAIERNLRIAYAGEKDLPEIRVMARATMRRTGANLISAAHAASLKPEQLSGIVTIENPRLIEEALGKGRGVLLLLAHMGNWELLSRLIHFLPEGAKAGAFYRPLNNKRLDAKILARRQADGTRMFSKRDPFHQVTGYLRDGAAVGVLVDQRVGRKGDPVDFFGRRTLASPLPGLLIRRTGCEVLALSFFSDRPGHWTGRLLPVDGPPTTQNCMAALEAAMKPHPEDVFWLQERWKVQVRGRKWRPEVPTDDGVPTAKPPRVLVWCGSAGEAKCPEGTWEKSCVRYEFAIPDGIARPSWLPADARCHGVPGGAGLWRQAIQRIDEAEVLPLDVILILGDDGRVHEAARHAGIAAVMVPPMNRQE